jgi:uncharacterized membrane protein
MNFIEEYTYQLLLLVGLFFVVIGLITYKFPPKKINVLYGYRTPSSMKNQERWDFAQHFSSIRMMKTGGYFIFLSFYKFFFEFNEMVFSLLVLVLGILFLFYSTEKAIRKNFPENVN